MQPDPFQPDLPGPLKPVDPGSPDPDDDEEEHSGKRLVVLEDLPKQDYREISFSGTNCTFKIASTDKGDSLKQMQTIAISMLRKIKGD